MHFRTSGTTAGDRGNHYMPDADVYALAVKTGIARLPFPIPLKNTLSLCPSADEFPDSSLGHMIRILSPKAQSFFTKKEGVQAKACWNTLQSATDPVFLPSTALALAELLASGESATLPAGSVLMITGGYKGRFESSKDIITFSEEQGFQVLQSVEMYYERSNHTSITV